MAKNPDPTLALTSLQGVTRTLDDWLTMFHLCLVVLPDRPEAARWLPVIRRMFKVLGDADCRTAVCVTGNAQIAHRVLDTAVGEFLVFVDPERELVTSLGLTHLPAFVHLRQNTTLVSAAEGWDPHAWQRVARGVAEAMAWSTPTVSGAGDPRPTEGWAV
ncbi:MAG: hypothetical protein U0V73_00270 [Acidimicrobiia bacterium]